MGKIGHLYAVQSAFLKKYASFSGVLQNTTNNRPYLLIDKNTQNNIGYFVPLSTRTEKYYAIELHKQKRKGFCDNFVFVDVGKRANVILLQNMIVAPLNVSIPYSINNTHFRMTHKIMKEATEKLEHNKKEKFNMAYNDLNKMQKNIIKEQRIEKEKDFER